jgi:hypothetical protein
MDRSAWRNERNTQPSCKPHDPGLASSQLRRYFLARALTEPLRPPLRKFDATELAIIESFDRHVPIGTEQLRKQRSRGANTTVWPVPTARGSFNLAVQSAPTYPVSGIASLAKMEIRTVRSS